MIVEVFQMATDWLWLSFRFLAFFLSTNLEISEKWIGELTFIILLKEWIITWTYWGISSSVNDFRVKLVPLSNIYWIWSRVISILKSNIWELFSLSKDFSFGTRPFPNLRSYSAKPNLTRWTLSIIVSVLAKSNNLKTDCAAGYYG